MGAKTIVYPLIPGTAVTDSGGLWKEQTAASGQTWLSLLYSISYCYCKEQTLD